MPSVKIPLPSLGVDLLSDQTSLSSGAVRSATDVDIKANGAFSRRDGFTTVTAGDGYTNLYAGTKGILVGRGTGLYALDKTTYSQTFICDMGVEAPIDFTTYNEHLYICGPRALWWVPGDEGSPRKVGVLLPDTLPDLAPYASGTLTPGKYGVALSWVDSRGEESPVRFMGTYTLTAGLQLTNLTVRGGYTYRLYVTPTDGDTLYLADEWPALMATHTATLAPNGAPCGNLHLAPMPPGDFVRGEKGRLYVAAGDTLWFSEPMHPHLTDPRYNFIKFVGNIRFIEPVNFGMYVGDDRGVWWLAGNDPSKFELQSVSDAPAIRRSSLTILTSMIGARVAGDKFRDTENNFALWLSTHGYMVGSTQGQVTALHPERIRLAADLEGKSVFLVRDGVKQIITLTAANQSSVPIFGAALDTPLQ